MKRFITVLLCISFILCLAACGASVISEPGEKADDGSSDPSSAEATPGMPGNEAPSAGDKESLSKVRGTLSTEELRLNRFLTNIVQQNIVNTRTDLDEDAELVRFVFGYRKMNDPDSVLQQEDDGVSCRTLTLEQVNETLDKLFGKSISPDREDYSVPCNESEVFNCVFRDGCFRNISPYPIERYSFPLRFALVEDVDEENCILHFRLYRINPWIWGEDEAERHVGVLPSMDFLDAEGNDFISLLGKGEATVRGLDEELQLVELVTKLYD